MVLARPYRTVRSGGVLSSQFPVLVPEMVGIFDSVTISRMLEKQWHPPQLKPYGVNIGGLLIFGISVSLGQRVLVNPNVKRGSWFLIVLSTSVGLYWLQSATENYGVHRDLSLWFSIYRCGTL